MSRFNKNNDKILITSALPYVNNVPHLGNIIGCVLSADVFARFCRLKGLNTLYVCGTDEHGTATETKALEEGLTPKEICDKYYKIHKQIYEWFGCSFDCFGRTSTETHKEITQELFKSLDEKGYITQNIVEQLYCKSCDKFLADRFVEGECPHCEYEKARGDQCDDCGKLLNAVDLVKPKCKACGATPEIVESEHLFLDLPKIGPKLEAWVNKQNVDGYWPQNARTITKAWFTEGLKNRCISRDLKWGVPIPKEGFTNKVFYVWFDAPIGYISITKHAREDWKDWWFNQEGKVKLYQFMAKDNIPFHTIIFPSTLLGVDEGHTLLHHINSTEYLNYENGKFSKSNNQGVFGDNAIDSGIPPDVWRYYLLANRPENSDTEFSWKDFQEKTNNELIANLGNFVNRALSFTKRSFEGCVPGRKLNMLDEKFISDVNNTLAKINSSMDEVKIRESVKQIMHLSKLGNQYFQENEPWKAIKTDHERAETCLNMCLNLVNILSAVVHPILPFSSDKMRAQLGVQSELKWIEKFELTLNKGRMIGLPEVLFNKLEDDEIKEYREKYSGKQEKVEEDVFSKVDLRVAEILGVDDHPNADKLYVLQIDLGSEKRQLVAGLKPYMTKESMVGKKIVVVANLKPAKLKGIESNGMLLAADKNDKVILLEAKSSALGERVTVEGIESYTSKQIDFKEFMKIELITKDSKVLYNDKPLRTEKEEICASIEDGAKVR